MLVMRALLSDDSHRNVSLAAPSMVTRLRLREEIKKLKISEEDFAERANLSYTWLRKVLGGENPGEVARSSIRAALSSCTICGHAIEPPPDEELFAIAPRKRSRR